MAKLKYRIAEKVAALPRSIKVADILKTLFKDHQISRDQFYRDKALTVDDVTSIPEYRLEVYALLFDCHTDDLKNYTVKGKSLTEKFSKVKIKTGLS